MAEPNEVDNLKVDKHWYVIYTRPRWEKKVVELLNSVNVENYCPLNKVIRQWSDRKKSVLEPLFKSYVFVKVSEKEKWQIKEIPGVVNYVYTLGKPAIVHENEIEIIREFLKNHEEVFVQQFQIKEGDKVRINSGAFLNIEGNVVALKGKQVYVHIPSLNVALIALEADKVEVVEKSVPKE